MLVQECEQRQLERHEPQRHLENTNRSALRDDEQPEARYCGHAHIDSIRLPGDEVADQDRGHPRQEFEVDRPPGGPAQPPLERHGGRHGV